MTPALILKSLEDALSPLVIAEKGAVSTSQTPQDTLGMLTKSPGKWRCILQWEGHNGDAGTHGSSKVGRVAVIIQAAKGLQVDRGADAHRSRGDGERPILELVSLVNNWIRGVIFTDDEGELLDDIETHKSNGRRQVFSEDDGDWLEYEGVEVRQYQTTHSLRYADRAIDDQVRTVTIALETPVAQILRYEAEGDGTTLEFTAEDMRRIYMVYLNGQAISKDDVTLAANVATFAQAPQPGDTLLFVGAS